MLYSEIVTSGEFQEMAGTARMLVLSREGQPPQSPAWQAFHHPSDARGKGNRQGAGAKIKKDLGVK